MYTTEFDKEFINRTLELIEKNETDYFTKNEVTLLLNCSLALVTLPIERKKDRMTKRSANYRRNVVQKLGMLGVRIVKQKHTTSFYIFRSIRNAISHMNITLEGDSENRIKSIILKDRDNINSPFHFEAHFSVEQLTSFAKFTAKSFLDTYYADT